MVKLFVYLFENWDTVVIVILVVVAVIVISGIAIGSSEYSKSSSSSDKRHRHYCDTCMHGKWNRGRCYCEIYNNTMRVDEISKNAGCQKWVSRR